MIAKACLFFVPILATLAGGLGCAGSADPRVRVALDQMTAELTAVEDRYYDLEYKYQLAQDELAACRADGSTTCLPGESDGGIISGDVAEPIMIDMPVEASTEMMMPNIDMGIPSDYQLQSGDFEIGPVSHISLSPRESGAVDLNADSIDDALTLRLLPADNHETVVNEAGDVTVSLLDPAAEGDAQRVGLWRFDADEISELLINANRDGISMELPWQNGPPQNNELMLHVRYESVDGKRFETSMGIVANIEGSVVRSPADDVFTPAEQKADVGPNARQASMLVTQPPVTQPPVTQFPLSNDRPVSAFVPVEEIGDPSPELDLEWKPIR